ncbi:MAG: asparagine--tRNA ligase [Planctomycetota bacterium]|nr:asparagine--tRNA ligase [Planctomycetota bacterium]
MTESASTSISKLKDHVGQEVTIRGWLYNRRSSGKIQFLQIRDGTGIVQGVLVKKEVPEHLFESSDLIPQESSIEIRGTVREDSRAPGGFELSLVEVSVIQAAVDYPITKQAHGPDFLLSNRHLWIRSRKQHATLMVRDEILKATRDFFYDREFVCVDSPIFTPAACEGTTTLFEVDYFDEKAYLTQSGQLYNEASCMAFGKVYCFGPTFRAEKSKTRKHLTEFWMVEPEVAFADLDDIMNLAEEYVAYLVARVLERRTAELKVLERDLAPLEKVVPPFPRISYADGVKMIKEKGEAWEEGGDFGAPHEEIISAAHDKPVLVHRFPADIKAFYMKRDPEDRTLSLSVDMIAPEGGGEIVGGGVREHDLETLRKEIERHELPEEPLAWYLDLRRYGSVPHGGFGLGIERTVGWICGSPHVRETIPFPRMMHRTYP